MSTKNKKIGFYEEWNECICIHDKQRLFWEEGFGGRLTAKSGCYVCIIKISTWKS